MVPSIHEAIERGRLVNPSHLLVATDLDDLDHLTPHIVAQAKASGSLVTLVHAVEPNDYVLTECASCDGSCQRERQRVEKLLKAKADELEKQGISCCYVMKAGFANYVLMEQIRISGATRLMMASHGRGKVGQFLLGSVTKQMLGSSSIPIFIVPPYCEDGKEYCGPKRILHPVSLRDDYKATAELALSIAYKYRASLSLLHVFSQEPGDGDSSPAQWGNNLLAEIAPNRGEFEPPIGVTTKYGDPVEEILKEAARSSADWIVMGIKTESDTWTLLESFPYRVIAESLCPVLVLWHQTIRPGSKANKELAILATH